jgi:signal transduction histidine kinase
MKAFRATIDSKPALIQIDGGSARNREWLRVQDNGHGGVDLATSSLLFQPFERGTNESRRAKALGLGGSGLGLTIVKMVVDEMRSTVAFEAPDAGWSTSVKISWEAR